MSSKRVDDFLAKMRLKNAAKNTEGAGLPRFTCACGQEIWAAPDARISCPKCFGAFRLTPLEGP